jgi:uncharacterized protein (DUF2062 family)
MGPEPNARRRAGHDDASDSRGFLRRRVVDPVLLLLRQGSTPEKLAFSLALGATLGLFPVIGTTTALCLAAGLALRLSHPALQIANHATYPFQLPLILPFVRVGERLLGAGPIPFSVEHLLALFREDPLEFLERFGLTSLHGILGWITLAPLVAGALYLALLPPLRYAARRLNLEQQATA